MMPSATRPSRRRRWLRRLLTGLGVVLALVAVSAAFLFVKPVGVDDPDGQPRPTATYEEALARFAEVQARERAEGDILPECESKLLTTGERASRVIVLFHGYTNCPEQFRVLARQLVDAGYNVYIPRAPDQGEADREHSTLEHLTAEKLIGYANESLDIGTGLGDEVTVLGLSGGGGVAAYLAQYRDEVDLAVPIAPFLSLPWAPEWLTPAIVNLADVLPPIGLGVSASAASSGTYAPYASFDNNTKSAGAYMKLGQVTLADAARNAHRAGRTISVVNEADDVVSNPLIESLQARWSRLGLDGSQEHRFPAALGLPHDLIGPDRVDQRIDEVYPVLLDLLGAAGAE